jgi:hypothetical protein
MDLDGVDVDGGDEGPVRVGFDLGSGMEISMAADNNTPEKATQSEGYVVRKLDKDTASSIRKGQIITKVSDVVRELVDNAMDADASSVQVLLVSDKRDEEVE